jgi:RNA polymerase sigma factor (sigma-70 family)
MAKQNKDFLPYLLGNSEEEAAQTFLDYQNLLNKMAYSYSEATGIDKGDLFGEAITGLAKAKRDHDTNKASLSTYAFMVITDTLNDYARRNSMVVSLPSYVRKAHGIIERIKGLLNSHNLIFEAVITESSENIPEDIRINYDYLVEKLNNAANRASIDTKELIKRAEFIPISAEFKDDKLETETLASSEALVSELKTLMTDEEWFISQGIMEGKTYDEIGDELGVSGSAIGQKFSTLKAKIKHEIGEYQ